MALNNPNTTTQTPAIETYDSEIEPGYAYEGVEKHLIFDTTDTEKYGAGFTHLDKENKMLDISPLNQEDVENVLAKHNQNAPVTQSTQTLPVTTTSLGMQGLIESAGFSNLNMGFGAAINVSLRTNGVFSVSSGEDFSKLGNTFHVLVLDSAYVCVVSARFKNKKGDYDIRKDENDMVYIPVESNQVKDGMIIGDVYSLTTPFGESVKDWANKKISEGGQIRHEIKQEISCLLDEPTHPSDGRLLVLSLPKTSQTEFTQVAFSVASKNVLLIRRGLPPIPSAAPFKFRMKVSAGQSRKPGDFEFTPWHFEVAT